MRFGDDDDDAFRGVSLLPIIPTINDALHAIIAIITRCMG